MFDWGFSASVADRCRSEISRILNLKMFRDNSDAENQITRQLLAI